MTASRRQREEPKTRTSVSPLLYLKAAKLDYHLEEPLLVAGRPLSSCASLEPPPPNNSSSVSLNGHIGS